MRPSSSRRPCLPSLLRAGHHVLLPRAVFFRTPWVADTARYRPRLASQSARVSSRVLPCGRSSLAEGDPLARVLGRPGSSSRRQVGTWRHDAVTSRTDVPRSLRTSSLARRCRAHRSSLRILGGSRATVADRRGFEFLSGAVGVAVPCSFGNRLPGAVVASVLAARGLRPTSLGFLTSKSSR